MLNVTQWRSKHWFCCNKINNQPISSSQFIFEMHVFILS